MHLIDGSEAMSLLVGDGSVTSGAAVDVPIMDDLTAFTGDRVLSLDRAWALVHDFIRTGAPGDLGAWREL
ncbi:hypothetical protein [Streptomyces sp. MS1.AVA.4]|uniref:Uncharacterized protein n=1 Tax=Streptomyces pratisoli TaxID=3139917 RepID=A0ACC6QCJ7_9ACTN